MRITLKGISKSFGDNMVLNPIDELVFESGKFTTLLGPSGCGKTTLLRMISGLETPDSGEIWFDDTCVFSAEKNIYMPIPDRKLGFVFQDFALWPHLTVFENVAFGLRSRKDTQNLEARVMEALQAVRLEGFEKRYPHEMSGGQQQRVAFARAIVIKPRCILFDEPLSALDAVLRDELRIEMKLLVEQLGSTALFVTHDQIEAMSMSDQIVVMNKGNIEQKGTPEEIYQQPKTQFAARFVGQSNWIGGNHMFRPEFASLNPIDDASAYEVSIKSSQFVGTAYELLVEKDDHQWVVFSPTRPTEKKLTIYVKDEHIRHIQ